MPKARELRRRRPEGVGCGEGITLPAVVWGPGWAMPLFRKVHLLYGMNFLWILRLKIKTQLHRLNKIRKNLKQSMHVGEF